MNRDPLYKKIRDGLSGTLDGHTFQDCAVAILSKAHPNLAPLPGGDDAGMDGGFGTPNGPYPLICTVQSDVLGNFRKNISIYIVRRRGPRRAVIATSQCLSNKRKRNLESEATKLGVTIENIYDGTYFADQLYRDSTWRMELLRIAGDLPALSVLPRRGRFGDSKVLVGRNEDVKWLTDVEGDALIVGQPGAGKTFLHQYLARQGLCLFVVDGSLSRLADAVREQQPSVIVLDDAHVSLDLLQALNRLRVELGTPYALHVNCWPGHEASVQRILGIPESNVRRLSPLRRRETLQLIQAMGIHGPDWLQHILISNSDGKPGLAAALVEQCKREGASRIWSGEAAAQQLLCDSRLVPNEKDRCVLAAFAVGGDTGMSFADVSKSLGLPRLELRQITAALGFGGLVEEVGHDRLQVRPPALRPVLVRDVFYNGATAQPIDELLAATRSPACTAGVLLLARQRNANVSLRLLEQLVVNANTQDIWEHFAWVDADCAATILNNYPDQIWHAARGLLHHLPRRALNALLDGMDASLTAQAGATDLKRQISEWLLPFDGNPHATIDRRLQLLDVLESQVRDGRVGTGETFTWALAEVLQATFDVVRPSPGNRFEFRSIRGAVSHEIFREICGFWPRVRELFRHVPSSKARIFLDQLENWCVPQRFSLVAALSGKTLRMLRRHARQMLQNVLAMPNCNRAWRTWARETAKWGNLKMTIQVDGTFDALYAARDRAMNWEEQHRARVAELTAIARELLTRPIGASLDYLDAIRSEAIEFRHRNENGYLWVIYGHIAENCNNPSEWLEGLLEHGAPEEFVAPFLHRISVDDCDQYTLVLRRLVDATDYRRLAIGRILLLPVADEGLLSRALAQLDGPEVVEQLSLRRQDPAMFVVERLLKHPNGRIRAAAAVGEWHRDPPQTVRPDQEANWRVAVLDIDPDQYELEAIFERYPSLAFEWLQSQLQTAGNRLSIYNSGLHAANNSLGRDERAQLLRCFNRDNYSDDCFDLVLSEHTDLFEDWLSHQADEYLRLRPLDRLVGPRWEQMALLALDAGASPDDIAEHCIPNHWGGDGPLSRWFLKALPAYSKLANHSDVRLRTAGARGFAYVQAMANEELANERREEMNFG